MQKDRKKIDIEVEKGNFSVRHDELLPLTKKLFFC